MKKPDYIFTYKCRYCGATFKDEVTGEALATKTLIRICSNTSFVAGDINEKIIHYAEDHIGLADMIGCEIAKEHGYCDTCKHNVGYPKCETCQGCSNFGNYERGDTN
jgi:hypothetical protein